jgi:hypothetical protein
MYLLLKILISAILIAAVSEIAKRSTTFGALVASLPLVSVLAMIWLYRETGDVVRVAALSGEIFWLVLPSLLLFIVLPLLIRRGMTFYPALAISAVCTIVGYALVTLVVQRFALKT